jgi:hypothetical protein
MAAQENLLSKVPSGSERYRVDAAILDSGKLLSLPRLCFGEWSNKTLGAPTISYSQFVAARGGR